MALTRSNQRIDIIYVCPDETAFFSPDGEGRYWFSSVAEALTEMGDYPIIVLDEEPEDY